MAALIPYTIIAQGLYSGVIGTISAVTVGTCRAIKSIYTHENPDVNKILKKYDIHNKLQLIQSVLKITQPAKKNKYEGMTISKLEQTQIFEIINEKENDECDPIELCLNSLHRVITRIHQNLQDLNEKVKGHNKKYFNSWRTLNIKSIMDDLELNIALLDKRFDNFMRISEFLEKK